MQSNSAASFKQVMLKTCCNYRQRLHVMKSLTCLPKCLGESSYDLGQSETKVYLKCLSGNGSFETFKSCYGDDSKSLNTMLQHMLQWLKQMRKELPMSYSNVFLFRTLTGLKTNECLMLLGNQRRRIL
jgi:hypothetical protein